MEYAEIPSIHFSVPTENINKRTDIKQNVYKLLVVF